MNTAEYVQQMVILQLDHARNNGTPVPIQSLREMIDRATEFALTTGGEGEFDKEQLARDIEADYNVHVGTWNFLSDDSDHIPWLETRTDVPGASSFWERYRRFLRQEEGLPTAAVERLDEITDDILGRLEEPQRPGPWDRRGLVAGQVQSGKTANYTGLIAKALDSGYKLVVVLAGVHNSLRSQTQARIDEGILGFDTRAFRLANQADESSRVGVGKLYGPRLFVHSFTSSASTGDFMLKVAQNLGVIPGGNDPIVLVVKKNKSILTNVYKWATGLAKERDPGSDQFRVRGVPVLVIDDEADHASVNTKAPSTGPDEADPSVINGLIRQLLNTFDRTSYVAYTATPFANIFIDPGADHHTSGEDLFPRSFIVNLPTPSTYAGPERVFGLKEDVANSIEEILALPIVRKVADYDTWLPDGHKASDSPGDDLPETLKDAIVFFLMATAVRRLRGQVKKHNSMLVHVTRYTRIQDIVADQVREYLSDVQNRLSFGEGSNAVLASRVERLYASDLLPTCADMLRSDLEGLIGSVPSLERLLCELVLLAKEARVRTINGTSADALEYIDHPEGITVIAIGGDKLSRGLTLEGLSVSYYLRASKMYDTLMQMGRWFGYRPGYLDVCRLYTTPNLIDWYQRITGASAELEREFEAMAIVGRTPADFGLRVRQLPDGLLVTSPSKLRFAQKISVSFSGSIAETVTFREGDREGNLTALDEIVSHLGNDSSHVNGMHLWRHSSPSEIVAFLDGYRADRSAFKTQPKALTDYIAARVAQGELTDWTVVLADSSIGKRHEVGGLSIGLTQRANHNEVPDSKRYTVRRLVSPGHELVELTRDSERWTLALENTRKSWALNPRRKDGDTIPDRPSGLWERKGRDASTGLLLLYPLDPSFSGDDANGAPFVGFAASFPRSDRAEPIEYQVNLVTLKNEFGWDEGDLDE